MQLFVRDLLGSSLSFSSIDTVADLKFAVEDRTSIPLDDQRLVFGGRQLDDTRTLADYGLQPGMTVGLVLRLRGGGPKKRCGAYITATDRCSQASLRIVGDCSFCSTSFCGRHRLPEDHKCANLQSCKQEAFDKNKSKLEAEQTISSKIQSF
ncbi:BQ2448_5286 [Microbotryum intermedium]|uniref:BQ2448_5286 protein n=1 Tax=Microbotryum intermedium TaxID=269621 RepID=A0A238F3S5_9BASI|nr:BQ2448_5286 [Microbotryum intermedium]